MPKAKPVPTTRTLNEISKDYTELNFLLENAEEISPEQQQQIDEFLANLGKDRNQKIDAYCRYYRDLQYRSEKRKAESDRIAKLSKYDENKAKRLKWVLLTFMQTQKLDKIETDFNLLVRSENASAPVVLDKHFEEHPEELEEKFRSVKFTPKLKEIGQALKDGENLTFARFGEKGENLKIS